MEKFRVNLDRPEPDKGKIQAKKDFNSFYSTNFPKATLFHSKWFWGVSGIATIAMVVTVSLSSFSKNSESTNLLASTESNAKIEKMSSAPAEDLFVSNNGETEIQEETALSLNQTDKAMVENLVQLTEGDEEVDLTSSEPTEIVKSENILFELDFDPLDFPNLEVGNNLFSIDEKENVSGNILFEQEWDGVDLANINGSLNLVLTKNGEQFSYRINQKSN
jgi:hypothetical protein